MPAARIASLSGTQYQKAALRAVPPSSGAFSSSTTSLPSHRLNSAVGRPPPPPPTTTTSVTTSAGRSSRTGAADSRGGVCGTASGVDTGTSLPRGRSDTRSVTAPGPPWLYRFGTPRWSAVVEPVVAELAVQGGAADAERVGRPGPVARGGQQRGADGGPLGLLEAGERPHDAAHLPRQVGRGDGAAGADRGAQGLDQGAQLDDVARPGPPARHRPGAGRQREAERG